MELPSEMSEYLADKNNEEQPEQELSAPPKKKRKKKETESSSKPDDALKAKARQYCTCPAEWKSVAKYNVKRMQEFCVERQFQLDKNLDDSVFTFVHNSYSFLIDKILQGKGYVEQELLADETLRQSINQELALVSHLLSNKLRILVLTFLDSVNGTKKRLENDPTPEENNQTGDEKIVVVLDEQQQQEEQEETFGGGDVPGDHHQSSEFDSHCR